MRTLPRLGSALERSRWTMALTMMAGLAAIVHFSLPLVITYDTAHYHLYLPILSGLEPLSAWDRARQPGYPLFLWAVRHLLGGSQHAFLLVHFVLLISIVGQSLSFVWRRHRQAWPRLLAIALLTFFILLDPLVVGYYHVLLTECVAATIAVTSCFRAVLWVSWTTSSARANARFWSELLFWCILVVFSYHLKQSYLFCALIPFFVATIISFFSRKETSSRLLQTGAVAAVLASLGASISLWNYILPENKDPHMLTREPSAIGAKFLVAGLARAEEIGSVDSLLNIERAAEITAELKSLVESTAADPSLRPTCTLVYRLGAGPDAPFEILPCKGNAPSLGEAVTFLLRSLLRAPGAVLAGYGEGLLRMTRILPSGVALGGGKYNVMKESEAIGYMPYRGLSNVFWMPEELSRGIEGYRQHDVLKARGGLGLLPWKWFRGHVLYLFSTVLLLLVAAFPFALWACGRALRETKPLDETLVFVTAASATTLALFGFHVALGVVIDRYSLPAYLLGLTASCLVLVKISDFGRDASKGKEAGV